jgi:hypothetical protein
MQNPSIIGPGGKLDLINDNIEIIDGNVGDKSDLISVPFQADINSLLAYAQTGYYHVHGAAFVLPDKAVPVTLTSAAPSWDETGSIIEVIPANLLSADFDLHWCSISSISAALDGIIDIYKGSVGNEIKIGAVDVVRTANFARENAVPVQVAQQIKNTRISCKFTDSTTQSRTVRVKFYGHVYANLI